jgi:integrase
MGRFKSVLKDVGGFIVYSGNSVDHDATDFALALTDDLGWSMLTVGQEMEHLMAFLRYLDSEGVTVFSVTDHVLRDFRDAELLNVQSNPRSSGAPRKAKSTVNQKLRTAYRWLLWLRKSERVEECLIGSSGCQVTCEGSWPPRRSNLKSTSAYPLLFRRLGVNNQHRTGFVPDTSMLDQISEALMRTNDYIGRRNALLVDIAATVGLRRASINSLTIDQFDAEMIAGTQKDTIRIKPLAQKFGYENDFNFPVWLALNIRDFVEGPRAKLVADLRVADSLTKRRIFLSARNGKPMTERALTQQVSRAAKAIGAPKGASIHTLRAYFLNAWIDEEIDRRLGLGLDTSSASIAASAAIVMGHKNPISIFPYVARAQSLRGVATVSKQKLENVQLRKRIAELERMLYDKAIEQTSDH